MSRSEQGRANDRLARAQRDVANAGAPGPRGRLRSRSGGAISPRGCLPRRAGNRGGTISAADRRRRGPRTAPERLFAPAKRANPPTTPEKGGLFHALRFSLLRCPHVRMGGAACVGVSAPASTRAGVCTGASPCAQQRGARAGSRDLVHAERRTARVLRSVASPRRRGASPLAASDRRRLLARRSGVGRLRRRAERRTRGDPTPEQDRRSGDGPPAGGGDSRRA